MQLKHIALVSAALFGATLSTETIQSQEADYDPDYDYNNPTPVLYRLYATPTAGTYKDKLSELQLTANTDGSVSVTGVTDDFTCKPEECASEFAYDAKEDTRYRVSDDEGLNELVYKIEMVRGPGISSTSSTTSSSGYQGTRSGTSPSPSSSSSTGAATATPTGPSEEEEAKTQHTSSAARNQQSFLMMGILAIVAVATGL